MNPTARPHRSDEYVWREVNGEVYVLGAQGSVLRVFNGTGSAIWKLCDGTLTVDEIAARIGAEFAAPADVVQRDVQEFLDELVTAKIVHEESTP